ncbi:rRNA maturation RNase YbeY [Hyphomicrobium sp. NDB2Meth4]|uniref:rRNA maturation RNase YbeY n=1 Tax=Hyphomicrobium sp. NDB2Meth4 TaxID=1892846 RepID=UPI0009FA8969|nr:rRNA maturation RNase YbeY [Hyphomicrobium sp. NDB2Meth4]
MPSISPGSAASPNDGAEVADGDPPISSVIDVVHDGGDWEAVAGADELVRVAARAVTQDLALENIEVCVALSSDEQVAELNGSYRGKPTPTNVLSFPAVPMLPMEGDARFLGDIALALETLQREADDMGVPVAHHLQHLVVHGFLHLLGYDHLTDTEAEEMEALEVRILSRLGIADPYANAGDPIGQNMSDSERD